MKAHEQHTKECYKIAQKEIKEHCKTIEQSFNESHQIMNDLVQDRLQDKGIMFPNELQRMGEYYSIWIDIKQNN